MSLTKVTFSMISSAPVDVTNFGATGDGVTDDTSSIQAALNYLQTVGGGELFFPPGTYIVSKASPTGDYNYCLLIKSSNTTLRGVKGASVIKAAALANATVMRTAWASQDGIPANLENLTIDGLTFDGNWANQTWAGPVGLEPSVYDQNGLNISVVNNVSVRDVVIQNCGQDGFSLGTSNNVYIENVHVENCGKSNITMFFCTNVTIVNPVCKYANDSPDPGTKPYYTLSSDGYTSIGISYGVTATWGTILKNNIKIIAPTYTQRNGRGIALLSYSGATNDATDVEIIAPTAFMNEGAFATANSRTAIAVYGDGDVTNLNAKVIGGTLQTNRNSNTRVVDVIDASNFTCIGTTLIGVGASSVATMVLTRTSATVANATISGVSIEYEGAASTTVDVRSMTSVTISDSRSKGRIAFSSTVGNVGAAMLSNNKFDLATTGTTAVDDYRKEEYAKTVSHTRSSASIAATTTETFTVAVPGADIFDTVVWSFDSSPPANIDKVIVSGYVSATDTVTMQLYNPSAASVTVGTDTWRIGVMK